MPDDKRKDEEDIWQRHSRQQKPRQGAGGPPNLDELLANFTRQMVKKSKKHANRGEDYQTPEGGEGTFPLRFVLLILLAIWAVSGIFVVSPAERAVVLRFGQYARTLEPGPHWIPELIESRDIVNVQQTYSIPYHAQMLTRDENIVDVAVSVQYQIGEPKDFLYNVRTPLISLQEAIASALRQVVGETELDEILTTGRLEVSDNIQTQLIETLKAYRTGILIREVNLQPAKPPEAVTAAFDDAIKAREDEQRYINQAKAYAEKVVPIAEGQAARITQEAEGYRQKVILQAKGDIASYLALLAAHRKSPHATDSRLYYTTLTDVLARVSKVFVDSQGSNPLMYLPMDKLLKQKTARRTRPRQQPVSLSVTSATSPTVASTDTDFTWPTSSRRGYTIGAHDHGSNTITG